MKTDRLRLCLMEDTALLTSLKAWFEEETEKIRARYVALEGADLIQQQGKELQMKHLDAALAQLLKRHA